MQNYHKISYQTPLQPSFLLTTWFNKHPTTLITNTFTHTFINNYPSLFIRHTIKDSNISSFISRLSTLNSRLSTLNSRLSTLVYPLPPIIMSLCQNVLVSLFPPSLIHHLQRKSLRPYSRLSTFVSRLSTLVYPLLPPSSCPCVKMSPCPCFPHLSTFVFGAKHCAPTLNSQLSTLNSRLTSPTPHFK